MSTFINITGVVPIDDPFYRYKMPSVVTRFEKHWTVLCNLRKISDALHRQEEEVLKFIGIELCTQTSIRQGYACVKGHITTSLLENALHFYIEGFVLCYKCQKPETAYRIKKSDNVAQKCAACGFKTPLDMSHKVSRFIVAQYKAAKKKNQNTSIRSGLAGASTSTSSVSSLSLPLKSVQNPKCKKAAAKKPMEDKKLVKHSIETVQDDIVLSETEALEAAVLAVTSYLQSSSGSLVTVQGILRTVLWEQKASLVLVGRECIRILFRAALAVVTCDSESSKKRLPDFIYQAAAHLVEESTLLQRFMEDYCIACLEEAVSQVENWNHIDFVVFLHDCYDNDVLQEETILRWSQSLNSQQLVSAAERERYQDAARPFVRWLEEAESETDEEEEE